MKKLYSPVRWYVISDHCVGIRSSFPENGLATIEVVVNIDTMATTYVVTIKHNSASANTPVPYTNLAAAKQACETALGIISLDD